jgi:NADH-quinone oxidoreductase subunit N
MSALVSLVGGRLAAIAGGDVTEEIDHLATPHVDWAALAPLLVLGIGALLLLTVDSLWRGTKPRGFYALWTVVAASAAGLATLPLWDRLDELDDLEPPSQGFSTVAGAIGIDGFALFLIAVICASIVLGALLANDYLRTEGLEGPSLYVLMMLSGTGGFIMAMADDLVVLFLGLETLSIAAYLLAAMHLKRIQSQEAGMKYFVLGAFSSAFFLYGIAMVYGATGSTNLIDIKRFLAANVLLENGLLLLGLMLMLVGLGFKVAAVPFHTWTPDVYDGAPSPVVAYMATGVKAAGFAALVRVFTLTFDSYQTDWRPVVGVLTVLTLVVGAVLAIVQTNVKRMLAYSSISHAGFILVGVQLASPEGTASVLFYLAAYTFMVAGTFAVVTLVGGAGDNRHSLGDYRGLARTSPVLALVFTVLLLAQAGVPFTSGFLAKFNVISAAAERGTYWLAVVAMVSAVIAAYLYLRIVVTVWSGDPAADESADDDAVEATAIRVPFAAKLALVVCFVVTLGVGVYPQPLIDWSDDSTPALVEPRPAVDPDDVDTGTGDPTATPPLAP